MLSITANHLKNCFGDKIKVGGYGAIGLYDYDAVLYPDSDLSEDSQKYDLYDVLSMKECLEKQL